ncbi:hypothetical protein AXG93_4193s1380 [Marchantia polymorpha subsp. ruderalis]|uniref:Uncharacterized protein n=1 Tax=Marchantia polymorpha subsp. ruderalis TaxID=1480154 RepID=A0A176W3X3_MARPO|nr:hypothetical protein AXG93_4193s1380 [Marchantia polymorpha subsp. ruderalis]
MPVRFSGGTLPLRTTKSTCTRQVDSLVLQDITNALCPGQLPDHTPMDSIKARVCSATGAVTVWIRDSQHRRSSEKRATEVAESKPIWIANCWWQVLISFRTEAQCSTFGLGPSRLAVNRLTGPDFLWDRFTDRLTGPRENSSPQCNVVHVLATIRSGPAVNRLIVGPG